jgi:acetyl esterase
MNGRKADYTKLVDDETWAFIERTNSYYPPDAIDFSIEEQRAVYDRMCRAFHAGYPAGVTATDSSVAAPDRAIPIRTYRRQSNSEVLLLYFHGGGFVLGGLESHDDVCAELCDRTGFDVVSVDYRLAPEHPHPASFEDAMAAFDWAAARWERVLLAGDSAGGNLAAAVAHAARGAQRQPIGQVLIYPALGGDVSNGSYVVHAEAPMLTTRDVGYYGYLRSGGGDFSGDPTFEPLSDSDFSGLPPTVIVTAECDPLSADGETYRDRILATGGSAAWFEESGLVHGYLRGRHMIARAGQSFDRICAAAVTLGNRS